MISQAKADPGSARLKDRADGHSIAPSAGATAADQDLQRRLRLFLAGSNLPGLRHVETEVHAGTVTLRGSVRTFYEKQLAVRLSRRVAGVIQVIDSIEARGYEPVTESARASRRLRASG